MFKLVIVGTVCALSAMVSGKSHPINANIVAEIKAKARVGKLTPLRLTPSSTTPERSS